MERESLRVLLSQGLSVEKIAQRFGKHPSTVSYWMEKHGLAAVNRQKHAAKGGLEREQLEQLIAQGSTIAEIATEVGLSAGAVRYWLGRYGLRTRNKVGPRHGDAARRAKAEGRVMIESECPRHGVTEYFLEGSGYYRCKRCRSEAVTRRRRRLKEILVAEAGGSCALCGYDRCSGALAFHHLDPRQKLLPVSAYGNGLSLATLRAEACKCVLLCANCHAEVENGVALVSIQ